MMNAIVSSCFLFKSHKKEISLGNVKIMTDKIYQYLNQKKCKTFVSGAPQNNVIGEAALNLGFKIKGNHQDRRQGHKAVIFLQDNIDLLKELSLSYYSMPIGVALCNESIIAYSLLYLS